MIVNAPTVVALVLAAVRVALGAGVTISAVGALRARRRARSPADRDAADVAALRPSLGGGVLLVVGALSLVLLVEVLRSYVPEWEMIMCVDGITRLGTDARGPARFLPTLLDAVLVLRPLGLLVGAAWVAVHAVSRRAPAAASSGPVLLLALGAIGTVDAACEIAYLAIPKWEPSIVPACCSAVALLFDEPPATWLESTGWTAGSAASWALLGGAALALAGLVLPAALGRGGSRPWYAAAAAAVVAVVAGEHVLRAVVGPGLHESLDVRCAWCLLEQTTLGGPAVMASLVAAGLAPIGALASVLERRHGAEPVVSVRIARLILVALVLAALAAGLELVP